MNDSSCAVNARDYEWFKDNGDKIKGEIKRLQEVERREVELVTTLDEILPKLEETLENMK
jgi:hypothetical protein